MSSRDEKRKMQRQLEGIVADAKQDMIEWMTQINHMPSEEEVRAWQSGYLSGISRGSGVKQAG